MREQPNNNERYFKDNEWKVVDKGGKFKKGIFFRYLNF